MATIWLNRSSISSIMAELSVSMPAGGGMSGSESCVWAFRIFYFVDPGVGPPTRLPMDLLPFPLPDMVVALILKNKQVAATVSCFWDPIDNSGVKLRGSGWEEEASHCGCAHIGHKWWRSCYLTRRGAASICAMLASLTIRKLIISNEQAMVAYHRRDCWKCMRVQSF